VAFVRANFLVSHLQPFVERRLQRRVLHDGAQVRRRRLAAAAARATSRRRVVGCVPNHVPAGGAAPGPNLCAWAGMVGTHGARIQG
jgi:hypothetical protein